MSTAEEVEQRHRLPAEAAWFAASAQDGQCHYGELHTKGAVHAVCGAVFTPITNPLNGAIAWWNRPVDAEHGCTRCREAR